MRKTLIALILVLPMVFVLVVFSSVNLVSLGVNISVNGIEIHADGTDEEGTLLIRMEEKREYTVTAEVSPSNASEKGYTLSSSDEKIASVTADGKIVPRHEGTVEITAKSNDKSFTDSLSVVIVSSKPYDFEFSLRNGAGENVLTETEGGYSAEIPAGTYRYDMTILPVGFTAYTVSAASDNYNYGKIDQGTKEIFLPFSGSAAFDVTVADGVDGDITKRVSLDIAKPQEGEAVINGESEFAGLELVKGTKKARLFLECNGTFNRSDFTADHAEAAVTRVGEGRYILDVTFEDGYTGSVHAAIKVGGKTRNILFSFGEFEFSLTSDIKISETEPERFEATLLTGNAVNFYAVSTVGAGEAVYRWELDGGPASYLSTPEASVATVKAAAAGVYVLRVTAQIGEETYEKEVILTVINKVNAVQITNKVDADLAQKEGYTIGGKAYNASLESVDYVYPLHVYAYSAAGTAPAGDDIDYTVSEGGVAEVEKRGDSLVLVPLKDGRVTVTAFWKGNEAFGSHVAATLTLNVVKDAYVVANAPELVKAADGGEKIVLAKDISLGTNAAGEVDSPDVRNALLQKHRMRSTYNIAYYEEKNANEGNSSAQPVIPNVSYVLEFKNDVYGNGNDIDADNYTHALDGTGSPILDLYKGPLDFVAYSAMARVAGQDNIAFLIRTDGVMLYGVNLLGCKDGSLKSDKGNYDLSNLNLTGTTLEVNASADIINCRIRNGRNVVRAYGGNRDGDNYFIESLTANRGCEDERILVNIKGCILSQGREFILKIGANRALRASNLLSAEPQLLDQNNRAYPETANRSNNYTSNGGPLYKDPWFYEHYVMTDVTLEDSVIETSGLFTVGIESNFAGKLLFEGADEGDAGYGTYARATRDTWRKSGGTSFASVLRLRGDVRLYDWKDLSLVDASTLIESPSNSLNAWLKFDIQGMLEYVCEKIPEYSSIIETSGETKYVHGGIAFYGGGRNYSTLDMEGLNEELKDFTHLNVNLDVLKGGGDIMGKQGSTLPYAAGTRDFNFYMYNGGSANNYTKQDDDAKKGVKYSGVTAYGLY